MDFLVEKKINFGTFDNDLAIFEVLSHCVHLQSVNQKLVMLLYNLNFLLQLFVLFNMHWGFFIQDLTFKTVWLIP